MRRIEGIESLALPCEIIADIGCDHGKIGYALLKQGLCRKAIETDISAPSLAKARRWFQKMGCEDRADFIVGDGLIPAQNADAAVIAGMGGKMILSILLQSPKIAQGMQYFILQPNKNIEILRASLPKAGYRIAAECIAKEGRRFYPMMRIVHGSDQPYTRLEQELGPINLQNSDPVVLEYAEFRLRVCKQILSQMRTQNCKPGMIEEQEKLEKAFQFFLSSKGEYVKCQQ